MIDPLLSLAFSVYSSKGVYALLLGSGVSRASGVPTGWEILEDLMRKLAHLEREKAADLHTWYRSRYEAEPNYSDILARLAPLPAERLKLLQAYFEPSDEERVEGRKLPTTAHRAIAELVAKGYVRVIVTTNFDRLLEQALADVGIQPSVISNAEAAKGAMPLAHSRCTLVKVHGDYLDPSFRNTDEELGAYEKPMNRLLDQIFDEYGLIVSGWSGDWDKALRAALERAPNRRFTTFWTARGNVGKHSAQLIEHRKATLITITSAETFFSELKDRVLALEMFGANDPLSPKVAVARIKRYLSDPQYAIALHDLVIEEARGTRERTSERHFPTANENPTSETTPTRLHRYDTAVELLLEEIVCVSYWANPAQEDVVIQGFRRVAEEDERPELGNSIWNGMKRYPALILLYGVSMAGILGSKYGLLKRILDLRVLRKDYDGERRIGVRLHDHAVIAKGAQQALFGNREHTPLSNYIFERLKRPMAPYFSSEEDYERTFIWCEYFRCLASLDARLSPEEAKALIENNKSDPLAFWIPVNRFGWRKTDLAAIAQEQLPKAIRAGFFGTDLKQATIKAGHLCQLADRLTAAVRQEWGVFFFGP